MPFNNPILAGEELIRSAIRSEDFVTDVSGWRIGRDGSAEFNSLAVRDVVSARDILLDGESVAGKLNGAPQGVIGYHARTNSSIDTVTGTERALMRLNASLIGGRKYYINARMPIYVNGGSRGQAEVYLRATTNGADPTLASPILRHNVIEMPPFGIPITAYLDAPYFPAVDTDLRLLVSFKGIASAGQTYNVSAEPTWPAELQVEDLGINVPGAGANDDTGSGASVVYKTFEITPHASRSYDGAGAQLPYDNVYCMQGDIGIDGNRRSWIWFDANDNGGSNGTMNDMQGASSVDYLDVFLYYPHWYYSSGGRSVIGHHNSNIVTATEQGGGVPNEVTADWPGRNIGQWVSLVNSGIKNAAVAGTFEGLVLGNTGSANRTDYGYTYGANGVAGQCPRLRAGYWK